MGLHDTSDPGWHLMHFRGARAACRCIAMRRPLCSIVPVPRSQLPSTVATASWGDACFEAALSILHAAWNSIYLARPISDGYVNSGLM